MLRKFSSLILAGVFSLSCFGGVALAQPVVQPGQPGQQQFFNLTEQSLPQMLQAAGYQIAAKQYPTGTPYWTVLTKKSLPPLEISLLKNQQGQVTGLDLMCNLKQVSPGNIPPATLVKLLEKNHAIYPHAFSYNPNTGSICLNYQFPISNSNSQELQMVIGNFVAKAEATADLWDLSSPPLPAVNPNPVPAPAPVPAPTPVNPTPVPAPMPVSPVVNPTPAPVPGVAGTWTGKENISGSWTPLTFNLLPNGQVTMTTPKENYSGTWSQNGTQVTLTFPKACMFHGTVNGNTITGQGQDAVGSWNFTVTRTK